MKYSIIISPKNKNSNVIDHALGFIEALLKAKTMKKKTSIDVFLYGFAVKYAFEHNRVFEKINTQGANLSACSTIGESFLSQSVKPISYIKLTGLGQWMESTIDADKNIEFV